jgi:hypothetical protein
MDAIASCFDTYNCWHPDWTESDRRSELRRLVQRQQAIAQLQSGQLDAETVGDMLSEHGIEPYAWLDACWDNLLYLPI